MVAVSSPTAAISVSSSRTGGRAARSSAECQADSRRSVAVPVGPDLGGDPPQEVPDLRLVVAPETRREGPGPRSIPASTTGQQACPLSLELGVSEWAIAPAGGAAQTARRRRDGWPPRAFRSLRACCRVVTGYTFIDPAWLWASFSSSAGTKNTCGPGLAHGHRLLGHSADVTDACRRVRWCRWRPPRCPPVRSPLDRTSRMAERQGQPGRWAADVARRRSSR